MRQRCVMEVILNERVQVEILKKPEERTSIVAEGDGGSATSAKDILPNENLAEIQTCYHQAVSENGGTVNF